MIFREWRGRVPAALADPYVSYVARTGLSEYRQTPGNRGAWILVDRAADPVTIVVLSAWESVEAIRGFAGDDIGRARYYPEDARYLLEMPERLRHYTLSASLDATLAGGGR